MPDFSIEKSLNCHGLIFGLDEAGRGPWCGPVVAACVCFPAAFYGMSVRSRTVLETHVPKRTLKFLCSDAPSIQDPKTPQEGGMSAQSRTGKDISEQENNSSDELMELLVNLNDSKKLTAKKREKLYPLIMRHAIVGVGQASAEEIDDINILQASFLAMHRALEQVRAQGVAPAFALIDGNQLPKWELPCKAVIGGDGLSLSIAAASIIAKVTRDRIMADLAVEFPAYGWERNAGYGTADHITALKTQGVTVHHRRSYAPIKKLLETV